MSKISNTVMCTLHDFHCSKARFIHRSTVIGSPSCSGKKLRVSLAYILLTVIFVFLQRYDNNLAIRRQTTINVSTESASPVKPRQTKSLLFGISENEQEVTSNSQTNVGYLHESDNSAEAVNEEAIGKMGTEGDNTDKQSLSSDCDTSTSELVEFKTDKV